MSAIPATILMAGRREDHGGADARRDDAHILDRAMREQALHLRLDRGVQDADQGGEAADEQSDHARPTVR